MRSAPRLPDTLHPRNANVQQQSDMERRFWEFFKDLVSEWNPVMDAGGAVRDSAEPTLGQLRFELRDVAAGAREGPRRVRELDRPEVFDACEALARERVEERRRRVARGCDGPRRVGDGLRVEVAQPPRRARDLVLMRRLWRLHNDRRL